MKTITHGKAVAAALSRAARKALLQHKLAGVPIAVWKNGRVVRIPSERIPVRLPARTRRHR